MYMYSTKISFKNFIRMYIGTSQQTVLDKKKYKINTVFNKDTVWKIRSIRQKTQGGIGGTKTRYYKQTHRKILGKSYSRQNTLQGIL